MSETAEYLLTVISEMIQTTITERERLGLLWMSHDRAIARQAEIVRQQGEIIKVLAAVVHQQRVELAAVGVW